MKKYSMSTILTVLGYKDPLKQYLFLWKIGVKHKLIDEQDLREGLTADEVSEILDYLREAGELPLNIHFEEPADDFYDEETDEFYDEAGDEE